MKADTALIENLRDELAMLRHTAGELVPMIRERMPLSFDEREALAEAARLCRAIRESLAKRFK